jgi:threonine aldolase
LAQATDGKLTPEAVHAVLGGRGDQHRVQPRVLSVSQSTELGSLYTIEELAALADAAHSAGLLFHLDGSRLANAAAALSTSLRASSTDVGVDVLSFGGTKNGLVGGEAVVVLNPQLGEELPYVRKQSLHLASKMRFIAAQFLALFEDDLWLHNASNANAMARRLEAGARQVPGVRVTRPTQANAVFAIIPAGALAELLERARFYEWDAITHEVRWMCSWQTTAAEVDAFVELIRAVVPRYTALSPA